MPSSHHSEAALQRRREKQEAVEGFPGRLPACTELAGRKVAQVVGVEPGYVVICTDGSFVAVGAGSDRPEDRQRALAVARPFLEPHYPAAYESLDRLVDVEKEAMRLARLEKIVGAVETNLPDLPELRAALLGVLDPTT